MNGSSRRWLRVHAALVFAFLFLPIGVLVLFSFNASRYGLVWGGFTFEWYATLSDNLRLREALANSLLVAAAVTLISTLLGTSAALALARTRARVRAAVAAALSLPVMLPELVLAIALLLLFVLLVPLPLGLVTISIAHSVFGSAYVFLIVRARLAEFDWQLTDAARDLGASDAQVLRRVTLPLAWPGIVSAGLLVFTLSFDDFILSFFVTGPGTATLPLEIYAMVKRGVTPQINALATVILLVSALPVAAALWLQQRHAAGTRSDADDI
jgi:spermidine/putrescine transport system permease protein